MRLLRKVPELGDENLPSEGVSFAPKFNEIQLNQVPQKQVSPKTIIGTKIVLKGELTGDEDLQINGRVEGPINLNEHTVNVGEMGRVESNIKAGSVNIEGSITGNVEALNLITVKQGSNVKGTLISDRVQLDDGAKFSGFIEMK